MKKYVINGKPDFIPAPDWSIVTEICRAYDVNPYLIAAIGWHETAWGKLGAGRRGYYLGVGVYPPKHGLPQFQGLRAQVAWAADKINKYFGAQVTLTTTQAFAFDVWKPSAPGAWGTSVYRIYADLILKHVPTKVTLPPAYAPPPPPPIMPPPPPADVQYATFVGDLLNIRLGDWGWLNWVRDILQVHVINPIQGTINSVYNWARTYIDDWYNYLNWIKKWWGRLMQVFEVWTDRLWWILGSIWDRIADLFGRLWGNISSFAVYLYASIAEFVNYYLSAVREFILYYYGRVKIFVTYWFDTIADLIDNYWAKLKNFVIYWYDRLGDIVVNLYTDIIDFFANYFSKLKNFVVYWYDHLGDLVVNLYDDIIEFFAKIYAWLKGVWVTGKEIIVDFISNPVQYIEAAFLHLLQKLIAPIFDALLWLIEKVW